MKRFAKRSATGDRVERRSELQLRDWRSVCDRRKFARSLRRGGTHRSGASGQPGIAGSSHESLDGIADSARFLLCDDWQKARQILQNHQTAWVVAYDFERVTQHSEAVLNQAVPAHSLCRVLDRTPAHAPPFLIFTAQNGTFKLYRVMAR
jgi:hypothetical protein